MEGGTAGKGRQEEDGFLTTFPLTERPWSS